jgi:hypothetical protein
LFNSDAVAPESEPKCAAWVYAGKNTASNASLVLESVNIPDGSEIGVFTVAQTCGFGRCKQGRAPIYVWGDDNLTPEIEGATPGELLAVKALLPQGTEMANVNVSSVRNVVDATVASGIRYEKNGLFVARGSIDGDFSLFGIKVTPNPAVSNAVVEFTLPEVVLQRLMCTAFRANALPESPRASSARF